MIFDPETFQILVIIANASGMFGGIIAAYFLIDRKIDRKISKYAKKMKESDEGKNATAILKETRMFIEGKQFQTLIKEAGDVVKEARTLLKVLTDKFTPSSTVEEQEEEQVLPGMPGGKS
jgi:hypothetical protein